MLSSFHHSRRTLPSLAHIVFSLVLLTSAFVALALVQPVAAASNIVISTTSLADDDTDGLCTLREALQAAFSQAVSGKASEEYHECSASAGPTMISFASDAAGGVIKLEMGDDPLPMINKEVVIVGPVTLSGSGVPAQIDFEQFQDTRILRVANGGTLTLMGLTLQNGYTSGGGGAILGDGYGATINLVQVAVVDNHAVGDGGAILTGGPLNVTLSTFSGNRALGINDDFSDNPGIGDGGALVVSGGGNLVKISQSQFSANIASKRGGAIAVRGATLDLTDVAFNGNVAQAVGQAGQGGGAIFNAQNSNLKTERVLFNGNLTLKGMGGALYNNLGAGTVLIVDSAFNGNVSGDLATGGFGGAIYNEEDMQIMRTTFNANVATKPGFGGAILNNRAAVLQLTNSSFFANIAYQGQGGALANVDNPFPSSSDSTLELRNVTISSNIASTGGAIFNEERVALWNTIIEEGTTGMGGTCAGSRTPENMGHNLQNSGVACGATIPEADPKLDLPKFNGGAFPPLLTQALKEDSPAIDAGDDAVCNADPIGGKDQRDKSRPNDGDGDFSASCDIGAFEADTAKPGYGSTPAKPGPIDFGASNVGVAVDADLEINETGNRVLTVGNASFDGPNAADFTVAPGEILPIVIPNGAPAQTLTLRCTPGAAGDRKATLTLNSDDPSNLQVTYDLICRGVVVPTPGFSADPLPPAPVDFGAVIVGETNTKTLNLLETGTADLHVAVQSLTGDQAADFTVKTITPLTVVNGGAAGALTIICTPAAIGVRTAHLNLTSDDPTNLQVTVDLVCNGAPPPAPAVAPPLSTDGIDGAMDVVVSTNGADVYVTSYFSGTVAHFKRAANGDLTPVTTYGVDAMHGARRMALSPDNQQLYIAGSSGNGLTIYRRDNASGDLTFQDKYIDNPFADGLQGAYGVAVSPDGRSIYVAGSGEAGLSIFSRDGDDFVGPESHIISTTLLAGVRGVALSPDGAYLYAVGFGTNQSGFLGVYKRDLSTGELTPLQTRREGEIIAIFPSVKFLDGLAGAIDLTISPDGNFVYVASYYDNAVIQFKREPATGRVSYVRTYRDVPGGADGLLGPLDVTISPNGNQLYVAAGNADALVYFDRDPTSGLLIFREAIKRDGMTGLPKLDSANSVAFSADGKTLYATSGADDAVVWFPIATPQATLSSLLPASVLAGSGAFELTLQGVNFVEGSQVLWNGAPIAASFASGGELHIAVAAAKVANAGTVTIKVVNPPPGGGDSANELVFTISAPGANPAPSIAYLDPPAVAVDVAQFTLTVVGTNFVNGAVVRWNGNDLPTNFVSATELQAQVGADAIQAAFVAGLEVAESVNAAANQPAGITVVNPPPGGGASNAAIFTVMDAGQNPTPGLTSLAPAGVIAQGAASAPVTVTVLGTNFIGDAQVQWNGLTRSTEFVDANTLIVTLSAGDVALPGSGEVRVVNPTPGGGASNGLVFTISAPPQNAAPALTQLLPNSVAVQTPNSPPVKVRVIGSNFINASAVYWNDVVRPTTFLSPTELEVTLTMTDVASPGVGNVTVFSPPPGGGMSSALVFTVVTPSQDPPPVLTEIAPNTIRAHGPGSTPLVVRISGSNFTATAQALWKGAPRATKFINATTLEITLTAADVAAGDQGQITVSVPGAGQSNGLKFMVFGYGLWLPFVRQ